MSKPCATRCLRHPSALCLALVGWVEGSYTVRQSNARGTWITAAGSRTRAATAQSVMGWKFSVFSEQDSAKGCNAKIDETGRRKTGAFVLETTSPGAAAGPTSSEALRSTFCWLSS